MDIFKEIVSLVGNGTEIRTYHHELLLVCLKEVDRMIQ